MLPGEPNPTLLNDVQSTSRWTPTIILAESRRTDNEATAEATGARSRCGEWRSSADYVVRGGRGEPRGRKSGAGPGADNSRLPMRAEGGKRFRSLIRNP